MSFVQAIGHLRIEPWERQIIQVQLVWLDPLTLEYAQVERAAYERTNSIHSARCRFKARLPLDRAMAWTRERRMAAKKVWVTGKQTPHRCYHQICSHRIVFKDPNHAFEFRMRWC